MNGAGARVDTAQPKRFLGGWGAALAILLGVTGSFVVWLAVERPFEPFLSASRGENLGLVLAVLCAVVAVYVAARGRRRLSALRDGIGGWTEVVVEGAELAVAGLFVLAGLSLAGPSLKDWQIPPNKRINLAR